MVVVEVVVVVNGKVRNPAEVTPEVEKQNERKRVNDEQFLKLLKMARLFFCLHQSVWLLCYVFFFVLITLHGYTLSSCIKSTVVNAETLVGFLRKR